MLATLAMVLSVVAFAGVSPAAAAAGTPGVPSDPTVLFHEGFDNGLSPDPEMLTDYVGNGGQKYTAHANWVWAPWCNGIVTRFSNSPHPQCTVYDPRLRQLAYALGVKNGSPDPRENFSVSAYTAGDGPGANRIEFATATPLAINVQNRFLGFSVNVSSVSCAPNQGHAQLNFYLQDGATETPTTTAPIDACVDPRGSMVTTPAENGAIGGDVRVGEFVSNSAVLFTGSELGIVMRNANGGSGGNDHAFDDVKVLDLTPQLDKDFGTRTNEWVAGEQVPLTFTVTNSSELAQKDGWSFIDTLPAGLTVGTAGGTTTCAAATVTAASGSGTIDVAAGKIAAGEASCTVTVMVRSNVTGSVTNGPDNVTTVGLNPPGESTLTYNNPTPPKACTVAQTRPTERFWFFGNRGGIDFGNSGTTATPFVAKNNTVEGSTVVTDTAGNLQFWSNGQTIFNANDVAMPNGTGLSGNPSATQTVAAFPAMGEVGKYFVVTTSTDVGSVANGRLTYSMVDMSLDGGLGAVTSVKNVALGAASTASEALTAVPNADGTGFWVLTYTNNSPNVLAYEFDGDGPVTGDAVVSVMPSNHFRGYGSLAFSADLKQLVSMSGRHVSGSQSVQPGVIRLLNFDADSGVVGQKFEWPLPDGPDTGNNGYSADFSPAGDYVYGTKIFGDGQLYRYKIAGATTSAGVKATEEQYALGATGGQVRRGPDGKMYVAEYNTAFLHVVNDPDDSTNPGFVKNGLAMPAGSANRFGLPQMVTGCPVPPDPALSIVKTSEFVSDANSNNKADLGDVLKYTFGVRNTGNVAIANVTVSDPMLAAAGVSVLPAMPMPLPKGGTLVYTAEYTVTQADVDAGAVVNVATAGGTGPGGVVVTSAPDDDRVEGSSTPSRVTVVKKAAITTDGGVSGQADKDDVITYTFTVHNAGPATAHDVSIVDPLAGLSAVVPATVASVAPGTDAVFTATYVVTQADVNRGQVSNVATGKFTPPTPTGGVTPPSVTTPPSNKVVVEGPDPDPKLAIVKKADLADVNNNGVADLGEKITYSFVVSNSGNVDMTGVSITDPRVSGLSPATADIAANKSKTFTAAPYVVTQADVDAGKVVNSATAAGTPPTGPKVTSPPSETTTVTPPRVPKMTIVKSSVFTDDVSGDGLADKDDTLKYSFTVKNTGNVTLTDVKPVDPKVSGIVPASASLAPGETKVFTADYTVSQADVNSGGVFNTATATGVPPTGPKITTPPTQNRVQGPDPEPKVSIDKSADITTDHGVVGKGDKGDVITYTFTVTNHGPGTAYDVTVKDLLDGLSPVSPAKVAELEPGADAVFTATYVVKQSDIDAGVGVFNQATAELTPPTPPGEETPPSRLTPPSPIVKVPTVDPVPRLTIVKDGELHDSNDNGVADLGEKIDYSFTVTNEGNTTLDDVEVDDPRVVGLTPGRVRLAPGDSQVFTANPYKVTHADVDAGSVINFASGRGLVPGGPEYVTPPTRHVVEGPEAVPGLVIVKTAALRDSNGNGKGDKGEKIDYSFKVSNTGNVTLHDVLVKDPKIKNLVPGTIDFLAPGESYWFTADSYSITTADAKAGKVVNIATASGTPPRGGKITSDPDTATVKTLVPKGSAKAGKGGDGGLPDTGAGAHLQLMLIGGLGLVGAGGLLVMRRRRELS